MPEYTIHGGDEGKRRLDILANTIAPGTKLFLEMAGILPGMRCLDLGCGGGNMAFTLAEYVGTQGHVMGFDMDERKIQLAAESAKLKGVTNVNFKVLNAYDLEEEGVYDLAYSRFLLCHLSNPQTVLQNIWHALKPKGLILIEDTDFSGHFSYPPSKDFNRYVSLYQRLLKQRGADANIGQKLVGLLQKNGFVDVEFQLSQPAHTKGSGKLMAEITFEGISKALIDAGLISAEGVEKIHSALVDFRKRSDSLISLPRIFQVSGRRP